MNHLNPEDLVITPWPPPLLSHLSGLVPTGVSILHKPSGVKVSCDVDRLQSRNQAKAMMMLHNILEGRELARERARQKLVESVTP